MKFHSDSIDQNLVVGPSNPIVARRIHTLGLSKVFDLRRILLTPSAGGPKDREAIYGRVRESKRGG